jgi:hypothetical protein
MKYSASRDATDAMQFSENSETSEISESMLRCKVSPLPRVVTLPPGSALCRSKCRPAIGRSSGAPAVKREARAINHLLFTAPAFFDFNTFNARVINGSMPLSISVFLLSSLMSTGTPLPS